MQAILNVKLSEVNDNLLSVIEELLAKNVEIVIKKQSVDLDEFDGNIPLDEVMREFEKAEYNADFLSDLRSGFETSEVYTASRNENKTAQK